MMKRKEETATLMVRMSLSELEALRQAADEEVRTMSGYVRFYLRKHLMAEGRLSLESLSNDR